MQGLFAAGGENAWTVPTQSRLAQLLPDLDNLRAAIAWGARTSDAAAIHIALAGSSAWFWLLAHHRVEGIGHMAAAMARLDADAAADAEARLLTGWVALRFPATGEAEESALARAMALFGRTGNRRGAYETCWFPIRAAAVNGDVARSRERGREMEALTIPRGRRSRAGNC